MFGPSLAPTTRAPTSPRPGQLPRARLHRLAQPHLIRQDPVQPVLMQRRQPAQAAHLRKGRGEELCASGAWG